MNFFNNNISQIAITAFMDWFSKISIEKYTTVTISGDDYYAQRKVIPVPCQWGTREKFVEIIRSSSARRSMNPDQNNTVEMQWVLPRISVNLPGISYDATRRLVKTQKIDDVSNSNTSKSAIYSPAPYNLNLEVTSISRNIDENFQIMEQIIPFFAPALSLNMKLVPGSESESVLITLNSVTVDNPTDIPENDERIFTYTYSFTMKLNYYMPKRTQYLIDNITTTLVNGNEVVRLDKTYIESLNIIQDKFTQYVSNTTLPNPFTKVQHIIPTSIPSTYSTTEYGTGQENELLDNILNTLGSPEIILSKSGSGI